MDRMDLINHFGKFWYANEVEWSPGRGRQLELIGRNGVNRPGLRVGNFWNQRGLYILYAPTGPYYAGIATDRSLGLRIREHLDDHHAERWDRFSWFGFRKMEKYADGIERPITGSGPRGRIELRSDTVIRDMEALLIHAMGLRNIRTMNFQDAREWKQPYHYQQEGFKQKLLPGD